MKTLFLIFAIVLISYQAVPGDAQAPEDTIACGRSGGGCQLGACRPGFQNVGTCKGGTMSCCRWPRPGA